MANKGTAGQRRRLVDHFLAGGAASLSDKALLELLLSFPIHRKNVEPIAADLIRIFGGLSQALSATENDLRKVKSIRSSSIALFKAIEFIRSKSDRFPGFGS